MSCWRDREREREKATHTGESKTDHTRRYCARNLESTGCHHWYRKKAIFSLHHYLTSIHTLEFTEIKACSQTIYLQFVSWAYGLLFSLLATARPWRQLAMKCYGEQANRVVAQGQLCVFQPSEKLCRGTVSLRHLENTNSRLLEAKPKSIEKT